MALKVECFAPSKPDGSLSPHSPEREHCGEERGLQTAALAVLSSTSGAPVLGLHSSQKSPTVSPEKGEREEEGALPTLLQMCPTVEGLRVLGKFSVNYRFPSHLCSHADCASRDPLGRTLYLSFQAQIN